MKTWLCVDAGGTFVKWAVLDENDVILDRGKYPTEKDDLEKFLQDIEDIYRAHSDVCGVALSMPGVIDVEQGYMHNAGRILCCYETHMCDLVSEHCDHKPVSIENDGKAAARAEMVSGALKDCRNGVVLVLGTAIAGTVFLDRRILRGSHLFAGEVSYNYYSNEQVEPGVDNRMGKPETFNLLFAGNVTAYGIVRKYNEFTGEHLQDTDCELVFEKMEQGDKNAEKAVRHAANALAMLIFNTQSVVDPDAFAIGGGISAQDRYIELVQEYVQLYKHTDRAVCPVPVVRVCQYRADANLFGALYAYKEKFGD